MWQVRLQVRTAISVYYCYTLSRTTRVRRYQKKHLPTHTHPDYQTSFIDFLRLLRRYLLQKISLIIANIHYGHLTAWSVSQMVKSGICGIADVVYLLTYFLSTTTTPHYNRLTASVPGQPSVSRYQKCKTSLDLNEARDDGGRG